MPANRRTNARRTNARRAVPAAGLALALALAVGLSACGSDDDSPAGASPAPAPTAAAPATTAPVPTTAAAPATTAPVPPAVASSAPAPAADVVEITATEYAFAGPDHVTAGHRTLRIVNAGKETHELVVARLNDGVTLEQALQAEDPSTVVTGLTQTVAGPGATASVPVDLTPGHWAAVCMLPAADGAPHAVHGMVMEFTVS